jgi:hypothetical protein
MKRKKKKQDESGRDGDVLGRVNAQAKCLISQKWWAKSRRRRNIAIQSWRNADRMQPNQMQDHVSRRAQHNQ